MLQERRIHMDLFELIEIIVTFIVDNGRAYLKRKLFDFLWEKFKPILLKAAKKLWQMLKDKLQKIKKKWLDFRQRKRACPNTQTLIFMNEYQEDNHSYNFLIIIIVTQKYMIIIIIVRQK